MSRYQTSSEANTRAIGESEFSLSTKDNETGNRLKVIHGLFATIEVQFGATVFCFLTGFLSCLSSFASTLTGHEPLS